MGYAVRTDRCRYVEWREWKRKELLARELYDHSEDARETANLAERKEHSAAVARLGKLLRAGWRAAMPPNPSR